MRLVKNMNVRRTNKSCSHGAQVHAQGVAFYILDFTQSYQLSFHFRLFYYCF